ncbi:MAG: RagB/SusD family nutrient uptake outer membrane protein, partial [Gemmatimonadota bacterium]
GAVVDVPDDPTAAPGPIVSKADVYTRINQLLDQAKTDLAAAGGSFSFPLGTGFAGFSTPATFLTFNRGLRARSAVYMDDFAGALTALQESFVSTNGSLTNGVYHVFGTGSGDVTNLLFDPNGDQRLMANPNLIAEAQLRADQTPDLRAVQKIRNTIRAGGFTGGGITSDKQFSLYSSITTPVPIMRNEELILLRAEANLGLGHLAEALTDINQIRRTSGGLADYTGPVTAAALLDELLYNKRYSLLFEGGFSWYDYRHYNKLTTLDRALADGKFFTKMPFPRNECLARPDGGLSLPGCNVEVGM